MIILKGNIDSNTVDISLDTYDIIPFSTTQVNYKGHVFH